jgi:hypothetical protein
MLMLSDAIITLIIGSASTICGIGIRYFYASKCKIVKCCCFEIDRDTEHEQPISEIRGNQTPNNN